MGVVSRRLQLRVFVEVLKELLPLAIFEILRHQVEDFLLLERGLDILLSSFLDLERVQLLVREFKREPDRREVAPAELLQEDVLRVDDLADVRDVIAVRAVVGQLFDVVVVARLVRATLVARI